MRVIPIFALFAAGVCLHAQTPPPASGTQSTSPSMTMQDGKTFPLQVVPPPFIPPARVVIQVGDMTITAGQMDMILEAYPESQRGWVNGPGRQDFVDSVIRVLLLYQEGQRRKLDQTDSYKAQLSFSAAGILATHTDADIRKTAKPTDADLTAYFEKHKTEITELRARHILIRMAGSSVPVLPGETELTEEESLAKATRIRAKLVAGAAFDDLARTESSDPGSRNRGGELGFFKHGQMMPSFEEAAYALGINEISQPVKTPYGYHIIQLEEKKVTKTPEEMRPDMEKAFATEASKKFVEELKARTKVEVDPLFLQTAKVTLGPAQK